MKSNYFEQGKELDREQIRARDLLDEKYKDIVAVYFSPYPERYYEYLRGRKKLGKELQAKRKSLQKAYFGYSWD